jgi:hypothetical protein
MGQIIQIIQIFILQKRYNKILLHIIDLAHHQPLKQYNNNRCM